MTPRPALARRLGRTVGQNWRVCREVGALPENATIVVWLADHAVLPDQARVRGHQ